MKHTPWKRYRGDPAEDGDIPEEKKMEVRRKALKEEMEEGERDDELLKKKYVAPRSFKIGIEDARKHGFSRGCAECLSWSRGLARQPHTKECRERFETLMKGEAKVARAEEQKKEFERKVAARRDRKEEKGEEPKRRRVQEGQPMEEDGEEKTRGRKRDEDEKEDEEMKEDEDEMQDEEDLEESSGGKKLKIAGLEVEEAIRRIETWVQ